ncbi:vacuolar sorting-associated 4B [Brachionus plicatilis]|uniref:Vacuolar sorting-associated 4B n=1 Tax=Brachionus plicatilis TaxID=10195 RepID=A0A3M7QGT2_BRAPC|nr:vacuolar sorting-associated 4B [Brachionus plicatilis]
MDYLKSPIVKEKPNVKWSEIAGLEDAKNSLKESVVLPIRFPQIFTGSMSSFISQAILLYGPPGTGKSFLAKAAATEAGNSTFFSISLLDLLTKWSLESQNFIISLFEMARQQQPSILFIDQIEALCSYENEIDSDNARITKTEFLCQMDILRKKKDNIIVLGVTNFPWCLDSPIMKRFNRMVYFPLPELEEREKIFKLFLEMSPHYLTSQDFLELGKRSEGYSGSDISIVVQNARIQSYGSIQEDAVKPSRESAETNLSESCIPFSEEKFLNSEKIFNSKITMNGMLNALSTHKPTLDENYLEKIKNFSSPYF